MTQVRGVCVHVGVLSLFRCALCTALCVEQTDRYVSSQPRDSGAWRLRACRCPLMRSVLELQCVFHSSVFCIIVYACASRVVLEQLRARELLNLWRKTIAYVWVSNYSSRMHALNKHLSIGKVHLGHISTYVVCAYKKRSDLPFSWTSPCRQHRSG